MHVVDSSIWLEWFTDGINANQVEPFLNKSDEILVPAICIYEVYKILKRETSEEKALIAIAFMREAVVVPFNENLALLAADLSLQFNLSMADSIIYATGVSSRCPVITADADFDGLPEVTYIRKNSANTD